MGGPEELSVCPIDDLDGGPPMMKVVEALAPVQSSL